MPWRSRPASPSPARREREGFTAFRAGPDKDAAEPLVVRERAASLPPSQVRSFVFTELFVRVELEPRANDLIGIVEQWAPDIVVHEVAEFAAPLVATKVGIPYVEHSFGPAVQSEVIRAAGEAAAPFWSSHGLAPHPLGGFYRYLYLDVCPPSLQAPGGAHRRRAGHPYRRDAGRRPSSSRGWTRCEGCRSSTSRSARSTTRISTCSGRCSTALATSP